MLKATWKSVMRAKIPSEDLEVGSVQNLANSFTIFLGHNFVVGIDMRNVFPSKLVDILLVWFCCVDKVKLRQLVPVVLIIDCQFSTLSCNSRLFKAVEAWDTLFFSFMVPLFLIFLRTKIRERTFNILMKTLEWNLMLWTKHITSLGELCIKLFASFFHLIAQSLLKLEIYFFWLLVCLFRYHTGLSTQFFWLIALFLCRALAFFHFLVIILHTIFLILTEWHSSRDDFYPDTWASSLHRSVEYRLSKPTANVQESWAISGIHVVLIDAVRKFDLVEFRGLFDELAWVLEHSQ